ncbi:hypothetical protein LJC02_03975, partial [Breznakia sp. OttesenSCG-928-G09]|nr:hypothetical protein [Breznakia sp. OttesenSCG-928-G09]
MNLYASISQRKSCRKYNLQPLEEDMLANIEQAIKSFKLLSPNIPITWRFTNQVKGLYHVEAPHYLIISGQGKAKEKECTGFLFQQLVLWFDAMGIGCVWLGEAKDAETSHNKSDIITIAFGKVNKPLHRTKEQFKRKPIETITNATDDICMQAVRFAPSGMNTQPWYFEKLEDTVLVYKRKLKPPISLIYKHSDIDMGIALCHYYLACKEMGKPFHFSHDTSLPKKAKLLS